VGSRARYPRSENPGLGTHVNGQVSRPLFSELRDHLELRDQLMGGETKTLYRNGSVAWLRAAGVEF
jgi:hypothetical protein